MSKKKMAKKVTLPTDRTGSPINVGDILQWDNGDRFQVCTLTYYGKEFEHIGCWTAEDCNGEFADNLSGSLVVWRKK